MSISHIISARKQIIRFLVIILFLFWSEILVNFFPKEIVHTLPKFFDLVPGVFAWYILDKVRCPYSRLLGYIWFLWYVVGTLNTVASSMMLGNYYNNLNLEDATFIYFLGCSAYFAGLLFYEKAFAHNEKSIYGLIKPLSNFHSKLGYLLFLFPFAWLISIYVTLGYIPILSGFSIVDDIYESFYGPLYPYGAVIIISILYAGYRAMHAKFNKERIIYALLALTFIFISMADGKRAYSMIAFGGLIGISFRLYREKTWSKVLPNFAYLITFIYVGISLIREGNGNEITSDVYMNMLFIGVEFRDYVSTMNFYSPGEIDNYSWAASTLASMTNSLIMQALDLNKNELVNLDSAHAWAGIRNINFGIRTGILSELWFAYGVYGLIILFFFGLISGYVIRKLRTAKNSIDVIFMAAIFGLLLLSITNQSTVTFGVLPVFFYLYVLMRIVENLLSPHERYMRRKTNKIASRLT